MLASDSPRQFRRLSLHGSRRVALDHDFAGHRSNRQRDIDSNLLANAEHDLFGLIFLKARRFDAYVVIARGQCGHQIIAVGVGNGVAMKSRSGIADHNFRAGNNRFAFVAHSPGDRSGGLRESHLRTIQHCERKKPKPAKQAMGQFHWGRLLLQPGVQIATTH